MIRSKVLPRQPLKRVFVAGASGVGKGPFLDAVARLAGASGHKVRCDGVGARMYASRPDIPTGSILDMPPKQLRDLRRSVMKDVITEANQSTDEVVFLNGHCTFQWRHGSFPSVDLDQMAQFNPDVVICMVDNFYAMHRRLMDEHSYSFNVCEVLAWREQEVTAARIMADALSVILGRPIPFYIVARGPEDNKKKSEHAVRSCYRLLFEPWRPVIYTGFPMTQVEKFPDILAEIQKFVEDADLEFTTEDPGWVDEFAVLRAAREAKRKGEETIEVRVNGKTTVYQVSEILYAARGIEGQIYARDLLLIDQGDGDVSLVPKNAAGAPELSSGVERELAEALHGGKVVVIVWIPTDRLASPFQTTTAILVATCNEALAKLRECFEKLRNLGWLPPMPEPASKTA